MTNRREFLQATATFAGTNLAPFKLFASPTPTYHFIQTTTLNSWPIANPAKWCLDHKHNPILERAFDGLRSLSMIDEDRIIRLVVRRCGLNLVEVNTSQVLVHHWSQQLADLRPFFQANQLTSPDVRVTLIDRKKEIATNKTGDDFQYGQPIAKDFPIELFVSKWENRFQQEQDDHLAAPMASSGLAWDGLELGQIPWDALKSAWQHSQSASCLNCSRETILVNFGYRQVGQFNRVGFVEDVCGECRRSFRDETVDVKAWMVANMDVDVLPGFEMVWGKQLNLETK